MVESLSYRKTSRREGQERGGKGDIERACAPFQGCERGAWERGAVWPG